MYGVIETGSKQYRVKVGDIIFVETLAKQVGEVVVFNKVLTAGVGAEFKIGSPYVDGASVTATVLKNGKSKKVVVYKYKPKTGYHKKQGHRQLYTKLQITAVDV